MTLITRGLGLLCALTAMFGATTGVASAETAKSAKSFTASVGVNTRLGYMDTQYSNSYGWLIKPKLLELGVTHIRDGTFSSSFPPEDQLIAGRYRELGAAGIGLNLLVGEEQAMGTASTVAKRLNWIKSENLTPHVVGIEGENESYRPAADIRAQQCEIWNAVKSDPVLSSKPVIGPSSGDGGDDFNWYARVGDLSGCLDKGNLHPYPGEDAPHMRLSRPFQTAMDWGRTTYGSKTYWATENGYWNKSTNGEHVSERASGTYVPRMVLDHFRHGIERTQLYELIDVNNGTSDMLNNFGLLRTDGSEKPAYTKLANLLAILKDTGTASGDLGFNINCTSGCRSDDPVRHVLLKHSDGSYSIAFWGESEVWNGSADSPEAAQNIDVSLTTTPGKIEQYEPATGRTVTRTQTSGSTFSTQATDEVRVLRITPGASTPPPPTSMAFEGEGMTITPWFPSHYPEPALVQADTNASAGKRLYFRHYGEGAQKINTTSQANRVTVRAAGEPCKGNAEFTVKIDGAAVGSRAVSATAWTDYTISTANIPAGEHNVVISYDNDAEWAECNRNLYLDKATFSYAPPTTLEAEGMSEKPWFSVYPDPGVIQDDTTASANKRMKMQHHGELSQRVTTTAPYSQVTVMAKGDQCREAPRFSLHIDGLKVGTKAVSAPRSGAWTGYQIATKVPAGEHNVIVSYDNDYEDGGCNRNLYLDRVTLEN